MKSIIFATLVAALAVQAWPDFHWPDFSKNWSALRVQWSINLFGGFDKVPRSLKENNGKFTLKDDLCATQGPFVGQRYWYQNDPSVILIFDKNGIIAGIQTSAPKSKYTPYPNLQKYHIDDGDYWTLTAYFVDPSTICSTGRSEDDLKNQGTGTGLWLQQGPDPIKDSVSIPLSEDEIKKTKWGYGKCFPTMGQHYWYDVKKDMSCADYVPNCLLYNGGKLTGFCFATNAALESDRYDWPAPTPPKVNKFLNPVPDCFFSDPSYSKLSTLHVYFIDVPQVTSWC